MALTVFMGLQVLLDAGLSDDDFHIRDRSELNYKGRKTARDSSEEAANGGVKRGKVPA